MRFESQKIDLGIFFLGWAGVLRWAGALYINNNKKIQCRPISYLGWGLGAGPKISVQACACTGP